MRVLRLNLKRKWWQQIRDGKKHCEMRRVTPYWKKRIGGKCFDVVELCDGYPKRGDKSRVLSRRWTLTAKETVVHEAFGGDPVEVYVIGFSKEQA